MSSSSATTTRRLTGTTRRPRLGCGTLGVPLGEASLSPCHCPYCPQATKQHQLKRYHSQSYVNGSRCDLTGRAREAEVRVSVTPPVVSPLSPPRWHLTCVSPRPPAQFLCEEGAGDYIARVDEPQSCSYVLTVHTTRICHHPFLRPPARAAPQPIRCQPALSPAQYVQYVRAQVCEYPRGG